ncbi:SHE10 Outer spore wall assembly protein SHE10 [Candida maltosa Xu316]
MERVLSIGDHIADHIQCGIDSWNKNVVPRLIIYWALVKHAFDEYVVKNVVWGLEQVKAIGFVQDVIYWIDNNEVIVKLKTSKQALKFHEKSKFIQNEVKNFINSNEFSPRVFKDNVIQVVKDILGDKGESEEHDDKYSDGDVGSSDDGYSEDDELSEEDLEPETVIITSTIVVKEENKAISTDDPILGPIYHEINYWETKVNKTIGLAIKNLEYEMNPIIDEKIESIKPEISSILQYLQKTDHLLYKKMHEKISLINQDYALMKETNDTEIETINRQEIRDDISNCTKINEDEGEKIQQLLISSHEELLVVYFEKLQETIDILESSSEQIINDFQNQLNALISQLTTEEDEINWFFWKRFHAIKSSLFDFRDNIYNQANLYKRQNQQDEILGLKKWEDYLKNVEFTLNFLLRDNIEYLQIIRAKANIAFQMREGLVMDLLEERERQEKEREELEKQQVLQKERELESEQEEVKEESKKSSEEEIESEKDSNVEGEHTDSKEKEEVVEEQEQEEVLENDTQPIEEPVVVKQLNDSIVEDNESLDVESPIDVEVEVEDENTPDFDSKTRKDNEQQQEEEVEVVEEVIEEIVEEVED